MSASSMQAALYAARRRMGMLFQFGALFTDMSVFDNVAFPLREHTQPARGAGARHRAHEARRGRPARRARPDAERGFRRHGAPRARWRGPSRSTPTW
jgi:ABC-type lipoprotein export system ATPase subunit